MSEPSARGEKSLKANTEALFDELSLAYQWERPSLLLAVNRSRIGMEKARQALQHRLESAGHPVVHSIIDERQPDVAVTLLGKENPAGTVFFVSGLDRGGGADGKAAYRGLNLSREMFVENQLKVVFWLTPNEAGSLSRLAPDFWAFRHRLIEYSSPVPRLSAGALAPLLIWPGEEMPEAPALLEDKIRSLEAALAGLPQRPEALAHRIETHYLLGHARWSAGRPQEAFKELVAGLGLAQDLSFASLNTLLLSGVGILRHELGRHQEALEIFQDLVKLAPDDGLLMMNAAVGLCSMGKNSEGVRLGAKAVLKQRGDARLWNVLGHLQLALGRLDEALDCFKRAVPLAPNRTIYRESLAVCYQRIGLLDEALEQASHLPTDRAAVFTSALRGEAEAARRLMASAVDEGRIAQAALRRDVNLNILLDPGLIAQGQ